MNYIINQTQNASADFEKCLVIPLMLTDFVNTGTSVEAKVYRYAVPYSLRGHEGW